MIDYPNPLFQVKLELEEQKHPQYNEIKMNADGTEKIRLTYHPATDTWPDMF